MPHRRETCAGFPNWFEGGWERYEEGMVSAGSDVLEEIDEGMCPGRAAHVQ